MKGESITLSKKVGIDLSFHVESGRLVVDHTNLSPEETVALIEAAFPQWMRDSIDQHNAN